MIKIVPMKYDETLIPFNGDCWVNATVAAKIFDKRTLDWLRLDSTKEYAKEIGQELDIEAINSKGEISHLLVKVIKGGLNQGTWAMELVVIRYAAWLKPEFEILVYNTFKDAARKGLDVMAKLNKLDHVINTETKNVSKCARTMANWGVGGRKQLLLTARERVFKEAQMYLPNIE